MARKKKFKVKRKAWVEPEMMESDAFRSLSASAMWVLLRFTQKLKWSYTKVRSRKTRVYEIKGLTFTYSEAKYFGLSDATFYRAIKKLVERGFLDVEHRGGTFGRGEIKDYTRFMLSDRWKAWGTPQFVKKDFPRLKFQSVDVQSRKRQKAGS